MFWCSDRSWRRAETYILLALDIVYCYVTLMLIFGMFHCCSIICGELICSKDAMLDPILWISPSLSRSIGATLARTRAEGRGMPRADVTTKEMSTKNEFGAVDGCCHNGCSPSSLVQSWIGVCCAPIGRRKPNRGKRLIIIDATDLPDPPV